MSLGRKFDTSDNRQDAESLSVRAGSSRGEGG
jgi:hypothetical protein